MGHMSSWIKLTIYILRIEQAKEKLGTKNVERYRKLGKEETDYFKYLFQ